MICLIFDETSAKDDKTNVVLTLQRIEERSSMSETSEVASDSSHCQSCPKTWHSMASSATAAGVGLPGRGLHEAKRLELEATLQTMSKLAKLADSLHQHDPSSPEHSPSEPEVAEDLDPTGIQPVIYGHGSI